MDRHRGPERAEPAAETPRSEPPLIGVTSTPLRSDGPELVTVTTSYVEGVLRGGGLPVVLPVLPAACVPETLRSLDGVVLSGGGDIDPSRYGAATSPETGGVDTGRDELELELVRQALRCGIPLLAICRGAQVLNVALGGTLHQHLPDLTDHPHRDDERSHEASHRVEVDPGSRLARILDTDHVEAAGELRSNTLHHQAVDRLGQGLRAVAWAEDGTVEAIEPVDDRPAVGVQWHPELLTHLEPHQRLFDWVVAAGRRTPERTSAEG